MKVFTILYFLAEIIVFTHTSSLRFTEGDCSPNSVVLFKYRNHFECELNSEDEIEIISIGALNSSDISDIKSETSNSNGSLSFNFIPNRIFGIIKLKIQIREKGIDGKTEEIKIDCFSIPSFILLIPIIVALSLSFITGNVIFGSLLGILIILIIRNRFNPLKAPFQIFSEIISQKFSEFGTARLIIFIFLTNSLVSLLIENKLFVPLLNLVKRNNNSPSYIGISAVLVSLFIFFDDYASILITGNLITPLALEQGFPLHKLAFISHSLSGTQSIWIPFSSFTGVVVPAIRNFANDNERPFKLFLNSMAYQFYSIFMIFFVIISVVLKRDFGLINKYMKRKKKSNSTKGKNNDVEKNEKGDMDCLKEERNSLMTEETIVNSLNERNELSLNSEKEQGSITSSVIAEPKKKLSAFVPIFIITLFALSILVSFAFSGIKNSEKVLKELSAMEVIEKVDAQEALIWASTFSLFITILILKFYGILSLSEAYDQTIEGFKEMIGTALILITTGGFGIAMLQIRAKTFFLEMINSLKGVKGLIPMGTFLISAGTSLITGSSWATIEIISSILGAAFKEKVDNKAAIIGAMLSGAILGDNLSLFSETTALTAKACDVDIMEHFWGQVFYGLIVTFITLFFGYFVSSFVGAGLSILLGFSVIVIIILLFGRERVIKKKGNKTMVTFKKALVSFQNIIG